MMKKAIYIFLVSLPLLVMTDSVFAQEEGLRENDVEESQNSDLPAYGFTVGDFLFTAKPLIFAPSSSKKSTAKKKVPVWGQIEVPIKITMPEKAKPTKGKTSKSSKEKIPSCVDMFEAHWYIGILDQQRHSPTYNKIVCLSKKVKYVNANVAMSAKAEDNKIAIFISPKTLAKYGYGGLVRFNNKELLVYVEVFYGGERVAVMTEKKNSKQTKDKTDAKSWWQDKEVKQEKYANLYSSNETPFWFFGELEDCLEEIK